ncbi:DoxX family protein [Mucilaginibacter sp. PPCGB 2223]|uniref:DoxX family protein n=1 Tax=Mucilaginibacter sp. PPCGB 2223 TaxID=1886027 RepID=UPI000826E946|nr:DoxX family protein [Mucilaginibacter sp. PPCGB 2223]OCX52101.1 DoxX family protein [Mucilaginibacter sp. PPCGB 2223]
MAMLSNLGNYRNFGLLVMRVGLGIMFILHGYPILLGGAEKWAAIGSATKYAGIHFLPTFWGLMAACTETFGGFLLVIGLAFRPVCLLLLCTLIVAALMHFGTGGGLDQAAHAIEDAVVFAGLMFVGPGKYSVDKK